MKSQSPDNLINGASGNAHLLRGLTAKAFAISISSGLVLFVIQTTLFQILKAFPRFKRIYQPRTYLVPLRQRVKPPPNNPLKWLKQVFSIPNSQYIHKCGLDAYFFLRYLRMLLKIFVPSCCLFLPILLPLAYVGGKGTTSRVYDNKLQHYNVTGLDTLSWTNIPPNHTSRFWAHLVLALLLIGYCCYVFFDELQSYIVLRQEYLSSPQHRLKASASTVLVQGIPRDMCDPKVLDALYDVFPGGIRKIWLNRNYDQLQDKVSRRDSLVFHLENAETMLIRNSNQKHQEQVEKEAKSGRKSNTSENGAAKVSAEEPSRGKGRVQQSSHNNAGQGSAGSKVNDTNTNEVDEKDVIAYDEGALWKKYLEPGNRDTIRILRWGWTFWNSVSFWWLVTIPFTKPVDTIYYCRKEVAKLNREIDKGREEADNYPALNSAFVQFNSQTAAHMVCQCISHHIPKQMTPRLIEIAPHDVIWDNMSLTWWELYIRRTAIFSIYIGIILLWGVLVTFTGFISQIGEVSRTIGWLHWVQSLPSGIVALIQGTLPAVILHALITGLIPIFLRWLCKLAGAPTKPIREMHLQDYYFAFLFLELFLVATISSGLTSVVPKILDSPTAVTSILATNLPSAANYFFNYMILQTLSISASHLAQVPRLALAGIVYFLSPTPRTLFKRQVILPKVMWGSFYPYYTVFAVIGLIYSVVAPLVLAFNVLTFSLFWVVFRNNNYYITKNSTDTGGLLFPKAVNHLFVGLYVLEISLIGLFFIVEDTTGNLACKPQAIIMIVALAFTAIYQILLNMALSPLFKYLPITMEDDAVERDQAFEKAMMERQNLNSEFKESDAVDAHGTSGSAKASSSSHSPTNPGSQASPPDPQGKPSFESHKSVLAKLKHLPAGAMPAVTRLTPEEREAQLAKDPIAELMSSHHDELEDLLPEERAALVEIAFTHPAIRNTTRTVWIPQDDLGVSDDEIRRTNEFDRAISIDNRGAFLNGKEFEVAITEPPPDYSKFWLIEPEL